MKSHIVPKAYLKNFTKSNGKLVKLKKDVPKRPRPEEVHPSSICYQEGFYQFSDRHAINGYTISDPDHLEKSGFLYENRIGKLIHKLISTSTPLPIGDIEDFSSMLFDIKARNQYIRQHTFSSQNISNVIDELLEEHHQRRPELEPKLIARGSSFKRLVELTENLRLEWTKDDGMGKELHNRSLLENNVKPNNTRQFVYNKLSRGQWTIYKTTLNYQFITSDNPGFCCDLENGINNTRFIGKVSFLFPLTPYHLLVINMDGDHVEMLPSQKGIKREFINIEWVKEVNQITWQLATKEVYAGHATPLLQTWASLHSKLIV